MLIDGTDETASRNWKNLGILSGIGYCDYSGDSEQAYQDYAASRPDQDERETLWVQLLKDFARDPDPRTLFFYPTVLRGDAPRQLDRELTKRKNLAVLRGDEDERGYSPLSFYAEMIYASAASLIYMLGPHRTRASIHNARASLLAGIASGLGKPLLIVAEESFAPPIDYQDLLFQFGTARSMVGKVNNWLDELPGHLTSTPARVREALGLPLNLGEYVAEYEADTLGEYFVQTAEFERVLNNQAGTAVFVGRKGTGKTATMLQAAAVLHQDKRNLVTVIKPSGYELESLLDVLERLPDKGSPITFSTGYGSTCCIARSRRLGFGKPKDDLLA